MKKERDSRMFEPGQCTGSCPEGSKCVCHQRVKHLYHICSDPDCRCHSIRRYNTQEVIVDA